MTLSRWRCAAIKDLKDAGAAFTGVPAQGSEIPKETAPSAPAWVFSAPRDPQNLRHRAVLSVPCW